MSGLGGLLTGYRVSQALFVVAELGVADVLADGARTSEEVAEAVGADPDALYRVLRALAREGVFDEHPPRTFALTELGDELRGPLRAQARYLGRPHQWATWGALEHSVRTGDPAFAHIHGDDPWSWRAARRDESARFDAWMTAQSGLLNDAVAAALDFSRFAHVVDVGGGHGSLLRAVLDANPSLRGTLFDQQHVVDAAPAHERMTVAAGSFFDGVPPGGDAYVLKQIVHDWPHPEAAAILRNCAAAGARTVLLVERDLESRDSVWVDLQMLLMFGARERTADKYSRLFDAAGLEPAGATPLGNGFAVFEARAAQGAATSPSR